MSKDFRLWKIDEAQLLPPRVQDYVPKDHLSRLVVALVREELDLSAISGSYRSALGQPPFDPRLMTAVLLHGYASGIYSSRRIARAAVERADFMMIVAGDPPDFRTISEFRRRHLKALAGLFVQVLKLAEKAGLVKLGHVALDGTKIKANASKHKAMSYERMKKREAELQAEVDRWLKAAEAADAEEDKLYGDKRGDEMPDWVADKQKRVAKIRAAKAELEAEAKAAAAEEMRRREETEEQRKKEGRKKTGKPPAPPKQEPDGKAQRNFTDPESRILKTKDGYIQGYNAQAAVDATAQIIVAHTLDNNGSDQAQFAPLLDGSQGQSQAQTGRSLGRCRLLLGRQSSHAEPAADQRLHRDRTTEARNHVRHHQAAGQARLAARPHERQAQARRPSQPLPVAQAGGRAGVRADQGGERLPPVPAAGNRESEGRMGDDLHRPQPPKARAGCRMSAVMLSSRPHRD
ncbi:transposase [Bradyrhizobium sp. GM24.11]